MAEQAAAAVATESTATDNAANNQPKGQVAEGQAVKAAPKPTPVPEKYKVRYNGKDEELDIDEVIRRASLSSAAEERFQEAAKAKKMVENWRGAAKKDFIAALLDPELGLTKDQIRARFEQWYKQEFIDPEAMSPEQRRIAEQDKKIKAYEEAEEKRKTDEANTKKQVEDDKIISAHRETYQKEMISAAEKTGLPKTEEAIRRMAFFAQLNLRKGFETPMDHIANQVMQSFQQDTQSLVKGMEGEALVKFLGKDVIHKLRQYDLAQLTGGTINKDPNKPQPQPKPRGPQPRKTMADVAKFFDSL